MLFILIGYIALNCLIGLRVFILILWLSPYVADESIVVLKTCGLLIPHGFDLLKAILVIVIGSSHVPNREIRRDWILVLLSRLDRSIRRSFSRLIMLVITRLKYRRLSRVSFHLTIFSIK